MTLGCQLTPCTGKVVGRHGQDFTGFGRVPTDADGHCVIRTLPTPYISVCLFARGLLNHLFTRIYSTESDPFLQSLEPERRATLIARLERDRVHRFDVRLQGAAG